MHNTYNKLLPTHLELQHEHLPCPCCGHWTLDELGHYDICEVCFWEDDPIQFDDPTYRGGANEESLLEARVLFEQLWVQGRVGTFCRPPHDHERPAYKWPVHTKNMG